MKLYIVIKPFKWRLNGSKEEVRDDLVHAESILDVAHSHNIDERTITSRTTTTGMEALSGMHIYNAVPITVQEVPPTKIRPEGLISNLSGYNSKKLAPIWASYS